MTTEVSIQIASEKKNCFAYKIHVIKYFVKREAQKLQNSFICSQKIRIN